MSSTPAIAPVSREIRVAAGPAVPAELTVTEAPTPVPGPGQVLVRNRYFHVYAALRTLLSRLRSVLGSSALAGRDELGLVLPEPVWIDIEAAVVEVQRAQQTLERGDVRSAWALAQVPLNIAGRGLLP